MNEKKIEEIRTEHEIIVEKVMKECKATRKVAKMAIDIAADFDLRDEADFIEKTRIITYTIYRLIGDGHMEEVN